jgi:membrane-bound metal-dependent hydrolase YbcI (DUF457 family)
VDLFTHVLLGYLIAYGVVGFQPSYLVAGAIAAGLPDGDILLFPLARRWPIFRHHGITHSILGVTIIAAVGGFLVAPALAPGNPWLYFLVMLLAGLGHMVEDGFTHYSVPPFLPFSDKRLELDADRAINLLTLVVSVVSIYVLLAVERGHVAFTVYLATIYGLMVFFALYFAIRLTARVLIGRRVKQLGIYKVPVPTANPFSWLLLTEERSEGRFRTTFARYTFGKGISRGPFSVDVPIEPTKEMGPVRTAKEALERSYGLARKVQGFFEDTYHFGEAREAKEGGWFAWWYSLEYSALGRAAAVRVWFKPDGEVAVGRAWYAPKWPQATA